MEFMSSTCPIKSFEGIPLGGAINELLSITWECWCSKYIQLRIDLFD